MPPVSKLIAVDDIQFLRVGRARLFGAWKLCLAIVVHLPPSLLGWGS